ncbi:MAG: hypothetical protein NT079_06825 [Candidatus Omnitrophica bacterium]|nr:hypothetical protein [Candidatus Omnitrophota bacterium]
MTWVIGGATPFNYGVIIPDIKVTFSNGAPRDCLQKVYPVGNYILGGFAGSVKIGFMMLQDLRDFLKLDDGESENKAWRPGWVAENWQHRARKIFESAEENEKKARCQIILVGAHPTEDVGIPGWARIYISILDCPAFVPNTTKGGNNFLSIGSGSGVDEFKKALKDSKDFEAMKFEEAIEGGWSFMVSLAAREAIERNPDKGISEHLHIMRVSGQGFKMSNTDRINYNHDGSKSEIKMPKVATSYNDFIRMCKDGKMDGRAAIC